MEDSKFDIGITFLGKTDLAIRMYVGPLADCWTECRQLPLKLKEHRNSGSNETPFD